MQCNDLTFTILFFEYNHVNPLNRTAVLLIWRQPDKELRWLMDKIDHLLSLGMV